MWLYLVGRIAAILAAMIAFVPLVVQHTFTVKKQIAVVVVNPSTILICIILIGKLSAQNEKMENFGGDLGGKSKCLRERGRGRGKGHRGR